MTRPSSSHLTPSQAQVLQGLVRRGGIVHYQLLTRAVYGLRRADVSRPERSALHLSVVHLEQPGLLTIARQWARSAMGNPVSWVSPRLAGRGWTGAKADRRRRGPRTTAETASLCGGSAARRPALLRLGPRMKVSS